MTVRDGPIRSAIAKPRFRAANMLNRMWRRLPCSQLALSSVHHHPMHYMGYDPVMPNKSSARLLGARKLMPPAAACISPPDISSINT